MFVSTYCALFYPLNFQDWKLFGRTCTEYVKQSDEDILKLYGFLSAQIDFMTAAERKKRQDELRRSIENEKTESFFKYDKTDDSSEN